MVNFFWICFLGRLDGFLLMMFELCLFLLELALLPIWGFELRAGTGFMGPIWGKNRIFRAQILNNFEAVFILNISIFEKKFSQFFQNKKNSTS